jgi:hypothetical protein
MSTHDDRDRPSTDAAGRPNPEAVATEPAPLGEADQLRKDVSYSPGSETETAAKQRDPLPDGVDDDIDASQVRAVPGTGGPDDAGDVDVDPDELRLPGRG